MNFKKMFRKESCWFALIVLFLWVYLILRGVLIQPVHDEIATFFTFVQSGRFLPYHSEWTTNNHLLNSLLTFISYSLFGSSPIALRLPNLFFFPLYGLFLWKIAAYIQDKYFRWGFLISLLFVHAYIEFFALSRGYGLAMTFLAGSIWFVMKSLEHPTSKNYALTLIFATLSASAVMVNLNAMIVIIGLLSLTLLFVKKKMSANIANKIILILIAGLLPVGFFVRYLFDLNKRGRLDYGGDQSFWSTSVQDLAKMLTGDLWRFLDIYIVLLSFVIGIIAVLLIINGIKTKEHITFLLKPRWVLFLLLTGNLTGFFLEHHLFGILYPANRTSIQFILFFMGSLFFLLDAVKQRLKPVFYILLLPLLFFPIQFLFSLNLSKVSVENESIPVRFFKTVEQKSAGQDHLPILQGYKGRELRWAYINYRCKAQLPMIHCRSYPDDKADFQIMFPGEVKAVQHLYRTIDIDHVSGLHLLERNNKLTRHFLFTEALPASAEQTNDEYIPISRGEIGEAINKSLFANYTLAMKSYHRAINSWIVFAVYDAAGGMLRYERIPLNWYSRDRSSGSIRLETGLFVHELPDNAFSYVTYIWNVNKEPVLVGEIIFSLFALSEE